VPEAAPAITFDDVLAARRRLAGVANVTPVVTSRTLDAATGRRLFLKCESFQRGGAFKFRGAYNKIAGLPEEARRRGVVAFSSGNHAQGVALAARLLGVPAAIVMPDDAPPVKLAATRGYGAEVVLYERLGEDRDEVARRLVEERGRTLVPPYDDPAVMAGQGTAALELLEAVPDLDALVSPVSGGGLMAGSATAARALRPSIRILGVEPEDANDTFLSLAAGERVAIEHPATVADGLRQRTPGALTFPILKRELEGVLLVSEAAILDAVRFLFLRMKLVVEPSGAVGVAAALAGLLPAGVDRVGVIVSGGNLDPGLLPRLWPDEPAEVPARGAGVQPGARGRPARAQGGAGP
jgi:threonine dehydratase